ncbi:hypothetical protein CHARACLAT_029042 [Characodon lateralis]|uniref:Uncharacterized protein n=1 Tax=Characodon lateralis TaxID=208331 RepID=A0ABU7DDX3_9TELE|nr:hypothetical protein [Characodon lateralis]
MLYCRPFWLKVNKKLYSFIKKTALTLEVDLLYWGPWSKNQVGSSAISGYQVSETESPLITEVLISITISYYIHCLCVTVCKCCYLSPESMLTVLSFCSPGSKDEVLQ